MYQPLADWIRPTALDDVVGQEHILGPGAVLRRLIDSGNIPNLIFYGPSGTGKTTVANIIAQRTRRKLYRLNATTASIVRHQRHCGPAGYPYGSGWGTACTWMKFSPFNKKQQQSLLEYIENGKITLIASTTENPYFLRVQRHSVPLHRFRVQAADRLRTVRPAMDRAVAVMAKRSGLTVTAEEGAHGIHGRRLRRGPAEGPQRRGGSVLSGRSQGQGS